MIPRPAATCPLIESQSEGDANLLRPAYDTLVDTRQLRIDLSKPYLFTHRRMGWPVFAL